MKVLFLDHDGVICLPKQWGSRMDKIMLYDSHTEPDDYNSNSYPVDVRFDDIDKNAVKVLNEIIQETGCELVTSSDWRLTATLEEMGLLYNHYGISKKPIAFVPIIDYDWDFIPRDFKWNRSYKYDQIRMFEIRKYLIDHPEVTHWVAVDDLFLGEEKGWENVSQGFGLPNFVRTYEREGLKQTNIKNKIINFLLNENRSS